MVLLWMLFAGPAQAGECVVTGQPGPITVALPDGSSAWIQAPEARVTLPSQVTTTGPAEVTAPIAFTGTVDLLRTVRLAGPFDLSPGNVLTPRVRLQSVGTVYQDEAQDVEAVFRMDVVPASLRDAPGYGGFTLKEVVPCAALSLAEAPPRGVYVATEHGEPLTLTARTWVYEAPVGEEIAFSLEPVADKTVVYVTDRQGGHARVDLRLEDGSTLVGWVPEAVLAPLPRPSDRPDYGLESGFASAPLPNPDPRPDEGGQRARIRVVAGAPVLASAGGAAWGTIPVGLEATALYLQSEPDHVALVDVPGLEGLVSEPQDIAGAWTPWRHVAWVPLDAVRLVQAPEATDEAWAARWKAESKRSTKADRSAR